jgi:hypothetical protein
MFISDLKENYGFLIKPNAPHNWPFQIKYEIGNYDDESLPLNDAIIAAIIKLDLCKEVKKKEIHDIIPNDILVVEYIPYHANDIYITRMSSLNDMHRFLLNDFSIEEEEYLLSQCI